MLVPRDAFDEADITSLWPAKKYAPAYGAKGDAAYADGLRS